MSAGGRMLRGAVGVEEGRPYGLELGSEKTGRGERVDFSESLRASAR